MVAANSVNEDLTPSQVAQKILDTINQFPNTFDMGTWYDRVSESGSEETDGEIVTPLLATEEPNLCGSAMCAAGWAAHFTGWNFSVVIPESRPWGDADYVRPAHIDTSRVSLNRDGSDSYPVWNVGAEALGLGEYDKGRLFHTSDNFAKIALKFIAEDRPKVTDYHHAEDGEETLDWDGIGREYRETYGYDYVY